jgi:dihydrofolate synthase/folylpolyglutamate synthase
MARGVCDAYVPARLQRLHKPDAAELVVDVAHNPQAASVLADWLTQNPRRGRTFAVFGALSDKDVHGIVAPLSAHVANWLLGSLASETPRGLTARDLYARMPDATAVDLHVSIEAALQAAAEQTNPDDRILAFGSFFVAAATLNWAQRSGYGEARR